MLYDVVLVGGGPAGLSAALALGRARKRVLLCDAGPRRNALAVHMHNFLSRDGTPPDELRRISRAQLETYPNVEARDVAVDAITGARGAFRVAIGAEHIEARRVLLGTGMIDETLPIEGFAELWGHAIFQCPYCHGWEIRDRRWGFLITPQTAAHLVPFALQMRSWTSDPIVFTNGIALAPEARAQLDAAGIRVEASPIARLVARDRSLLAIALSDGTDVACDALFAHPPQRQVALVTSLGVALDDDGYVRVDPMKRETSIPGIYAAGDLANRMQAAIIAAGAGAQVAAMLNVDLMMSAF